MYWYRACRQVSRAWSCDNLHRPVPERCIIARSHRAERSANPEGISPPLPGLQATQLPADIGGASQLEYRCREEARLIFLPRLSLLSQATGVIGGAFNIGAVLP